MRSMIVAAGLVLMASGAGATEFCLVKKTGDGFAALRASPGAQGKMVARMQEGEEVRVTGRKSGRWQYVSWWKGDTRIARGVENPDARGWVHGSLIEDCG